MLIFVSGMTIEQCMNDCSGYSYFGVEYGGECKQLCPNPMTLRSNAVQVIVATPSARDQL
jgi:hypothetical protein